MEQPVRPLDRHRHRAQRAHAFTVGGQGFAAMSRKELLADPAGAGALELGVTVHYRTQAPDADELRASHDLVVAADGINSRGPDAVRRRVPARDLDRRRNKYIWLGTDLRLRGVPVLRQADASGAPCRSTATPTPTAGSTFIVEMHEDVWRRAGFDATEHAEFPPGASDARAVARIREIFADELGGTRIVTNNSKWLSFPTVRNERWHRRQPGADRRRRAHRALLDRLGHQAGDGGRAGARRLPARAPGRSTAALAAYQAERKPVVESTQRAAQASLEWFENIGMYADQDPAQFCLQPAYPSAGGSPTTTSRSATPTSPRRMEAEFAPCTRVRPRWLPPCSSRSGSAAWS